MIWLCADLHVGHFNIIEYTGRPFNTLKEMNETLVRNWNSVIEKNDTVYFLGDFCFPKYMSPELLLSSLNGNITLIKGNHDKQPTLDVFKGRWYKNLSMSIVTDNKVYRCLLNHRPIYPLGTPDPFHDHDTSIDPAAYDVILCGHIHEKWHKCGKCINVGVDKNFFFPISLEELVKNLEKDFPCQSYSI